MSHESLVKNELPAAVARVLHSPGKAIFYSLEPWDGMPAALRPLWPQMLCMSGLANSIATRPLCGPLNSRIARSDPLRPFVFLQGATQTNNLGQIIANGTDSRSSAVGVWYLLTPVL